MELPTGLTLFRPVRCFGTQPPRQSPDFFNAEGLQRWPALADSGGSVTGGISSLAALQAQRPQPLHQQIALVIVQAIDQVRSDHSSWVLL